MTMYRRLGFTAARTEDGWEIDNRDMWTQRATVEVPSEPDDEAVIRSIMGEHLGLYLVRHDGGRDVLTVRRECDDRPVAMLVPEEDV